MSECHTIDVSLFLSRLAGTVVWREYKLFGLLCPPPPPPPSTKLASFSFRLSFISWHFSCLYPKLHLLFISPFLLLFPLHAIFLFIFFCHNLPCLPLSLIPFSRHLSSPSPPPLSPVEVMLLNAHSCIKTTNSHYLLPTTQEVMQAAFPTLATDGAQGQQQLSLYINLSC